MWRGTTSQHEDRGGLGPPAAAVLDSVSAHVTTPYVDNNANLCFEMKQIHDILNYVHVREMFDIEYITGHE